MSFREPNGAVMTNMKPPQEGRNTGAPSLRGLQGRSATGLNGQAAKEEVSALWRVGWMPENISGVPAGRSVFHLTSPLIGLLARNHFRFVRHACWITASIEGLADERRAYATCIETFRIRAFFLIIELIKYVASHRVLTQDSNGGGPDKSDRA